MIFTFQTHIFHCSANNKLRGTLNQNQDKSIYKLTHVGDKTFTTTHRMNLTKPILFSLRCFNESVPKINLIDNRPNWSSEVQDNTTPYIQSMY